MNAQLKAQSSSWWQLITNPSTVGTYSSALQLTWEILKETAKLLWLAFCLSFVFIIWFWNGSINLGESVRGWYEQIEEPKAENVAPYAGRALLAAAKTGGVLLLWQAKEQLGLENTGDRPNVSAAIAAATPAKTKATAAVPPSTPAPAPAPSAPAKTTPPVAETTEEEEA